MNDYGRYRDSGIYDGPSSEETDMKSSQSISRPSGRSIYLQRKQYAQSIVKLHDSFQHRVEHLLTCDLDVKQMRNVDDAIGRLKMLDSQGRVWGQELILQVKEGELLLTDIETREELDCFSLESVLSCSSVLNSCSYTSVLVLTIKQLQIRRTSIYLFQCEELGADLLQINIEKAIKNQRGEENNQKTLRNNLENMLSQQAQVPLRGKSTPPPQHAWIQPEEQPLNPGAQEPRERHPQNAPSYEQAPQRQTWLEPGPVDPRPGSATPEIDIERDSEILNHVLNDIGLFKEKLMKMTGSGTVNSKTKSKKKKKNALLPPDYEYQDTLQKTKYAFNLLGKLNLYIQEPSAPDLARLLFSTLTFILSNCPQKEMASSIISPLLTQKAINLLNSCVTEQERNTWKSLGNAWMVTRADWPNRKDIPAYVPTFSDGWIPREPSHSEYRPRVSNPSVRGASPASDPRESIQRPSLLMRAMYDFIGRNSKELTVMKGDMLEVLDQSKQWWKVRNSGNESGYIPNNVLEPMDGNNTQKSSNQGPQGPVVLSPRSRPEEVTAWLREQGFSKLTVTSLGALDGEQLMGMSRDELKIVCPEDGGRVFLQLASVKSSMRPGR